LDYDLQYNLKDLVDNDPILPSKVTPPLPIKSDRFPGGVTLLGRITIFIANMSQVICIVGLVGLIISAVISGNTLNVTPDPQVLWNDYQDAG
jgi:hypothetical protein